MAKWFSFTVAVFLSCLIGCGVVPYSKLEEQTQTALSESKNAKIYNLSVSDALNKSYEALESHGFKKETENEGVLRAYKPKSLTSYRINLVVKASPLGENESRVEIAAAHGSRLISSDKFVKVVLSALDNYSQDDLVAETDGEQPAQQAEADIPEVKPVKPKANQPPSLKVIQPVDGMTISTKSVVLRCVASDDVDVSDVEIKLNGKALFSKDIILNPIGDKKSTYEITKHIPLTPGKNLIEVVAHDAEHSNAVQINLTRAIPPIITITHPDDNFTVSSEDLILQGSVKADVKISQVKVTLNGKQLTGAKDIFLKPTGAVEIYKIEKPVILAPGRNVIEIAVTDELKQTASKKLTVTMKTALSTSISKEQSVSKTNNKYAVLIGISNYKDDSIPDLRYARADAEGLYEVLISENGGFSRENIRLLVDDAATLTAIKSAIGTWLSRKVQPDDTVLLFYSGHGGIDIDPSGKEADGMNKYLIPHDALMNDLYATGLLNADVSEMLARLQASRVVLFIDSCYSGGATRSVMDAKSALIPSGIKASPAKDVYERLSGEGRVVISASKANEVSLELPELGHGIFTYHLLEGIRGNADSDKDGEITVMEMFAYLGEKVPATARERGGKQTPLMKGAATAQFFIATNPKVKKQRKLLNYFSRGLLNADELAEAQRLVSTDEKELKERDRVLLKLVSEMLEDEGKIELFKTNRKLLK